MTTNLLSRCSNETRGSVAALPAGSSAARPSTCSSSPLGRIEAAVFGDSADEPSSASNRLLLAVVLSDGDEPETDRNLLLPRLDAGNGCCFCCRCWFSAAVATDVKCLVAGAREGGPRKPAVLVAPASFLLSPAPEPEP